MPVRGEARERVAAIRRRSWLRRRRTGCWCSGRTGSGAPGRGRRRRASASSARTWWRCWASTCTARPRPAPTSTAEVMRTNFRSSPSEASSAWSSAGAASFTLACSEEPTWPAARTFSISLLTASRISRMRVHLARSASSGCAQVAVDLGEDRLAVAAELPGLFGREAEEGRHPAQHRLRDVPQRRLRAAPRARAGRGGVEPVLQDVEVEGAQVLRAVDLQLGHHRVELVDLVVRQHLGLELRGAAQRVAVDLEQLGRAAPRPSRCRSRWCWRAGSAACCGCGGRHPPRGRGSCRRRRCRPSSRWPPPRGG